MIFIAAGAELVEIICEAQGWFVVNVGLSFVCKIPFAVITHPVSPPRPVFLRMEAARILGAAQRWFGLRITVRRVQRFDKLVSRRLVSLGRKPFHCCQVGFNGHLKTVP
jgi:hypothetical protein